LTSSPPRIVIVVGCQVCLSKGESSTETQEPAKPEQLEEQPLRQSTRVHAQATPSPTTQRQSRPPPSSSPPQVHTWFTRERHLGSTHLFRRTCIWHM
jgi:hypothetical protein